MYLLENISLEFLFISEVSLVLQLLSSDDNAVAHQSRDLALFYHPTLFIAMLETVNPKQFDVFLIAAKRVHRWRLKK
jgi:hypothetical protein